jgi:hypothetical protein
MLIRLRSQGEYNTEKCININFLYSMNCYLILPAALGPGEYSACNRSEYQKRKNNNVSGEQSAAGA